MPHGPNPTDCWYRGSAGTHQNTSGLPSNYLSLKHFPFHHMVCIFGTEENRNIPRVLVKRVFHWANGWETPNRKKHSKKRIAEITWKMGVRNFQLNSA